MSRLAAQFAGYDAKFQILAAGEPLEPQAVGGFPGVLAATSNQQKPPNRLREPHIEEGFALENYLSQAHSLDMQTRCPKCTTMVRSKNGTDWKILNGSCLYLLGTQWAPKPEFCPTLSHLAEPDVVLPGVESRTAVKAEINWIRGRVF